MTATATGAIDEDGAPVTATAGAMPAGAVRTLLERNDFYSQECNTHGEQNDSS
uniref:Uncharacterized protein n=1 Tax=Oryza brachyantha TaxID=4533 RepID=J3KYW0_ORYBR